MHVFDVYTEVGKELSAITGHPYPFFETYKTRMRMWSSSS